MRPIEHRQWIVRYRVRRDPQAVTDGGAVPSGDAECLRNRGQVVGRLVQDVVFRGPRLLSANLGMTASVSRPLTKKLRLAMSDAEVHAALGEAISDICETSTVKV